MAEGTKPERIEIADDIKRELQIHAQNIQIAQNNANTFIRAVGLALKINAKEYRFDEKSYSFIKIDEAKK